MIAAIGAVVGVLLGVVGALVHFAAVAVDTGNTAVALGLLALAAATVKKVVDFVRYASAGDWQSVITQVLSWAGGIALAFILSRSGIMSSFDLGGGHLFSTLNGADVILIGLSIGSGGSIGADFLRAHDNTQSAAVPPLGGD